MGDFIIDVKTGFIDVADKVGVKNGRLDKTDYLRVVVSDENGKKEDSVIRADKFFEFATVVRLVGVDGFSGNLSPAKRLEFLSKRGIPLDKNGASVALRKYVSEKEESFQRVEQLVKKFLEETRHSPLGRHWTNPFIKNLMKKDGKVP